MTEALALSALGVSVAHFVLWCVFVRNNAKRMEQLERDQWDHENDWGKHIG